MLVSIDLSMRSTGVCFLAADGTLVGCRLISPSNKEYNDEDLLNYISNEVLRLVEEHEEHIKAIVIEGLSFNSFSSEKDKINGNFWHLRCQLKARFGSIPIGIIPVTSWRSYVLSKEEQKVAKLSGKDGLKKACVALVPPSVREYFDTCVLSQKAKKESIYDLTDAYHLGQYRLSLGL